MGFIVDSNPLLVKNALAWAVILIPLLSPSVVRDLGASFCKLNPSLLTDEKLMEKTSKKGAVAKPKGKQGKQTKAKMIPKMESKREGPRQKRARNKPASMPSFVLFLNA